MATDRRFLKRGGLRRQEGRSINARSAQARRFSRKLGQRSSRVDKLVRKRREEEDEEIMLFLLPALYLISNRGRVKRARHNSKLSGKGRLKEILHEKNCLVAFRMEPSVFRDIATFLREKHLLHETRDRRSLHAEQESMQSSSLHAHAEHAGFAWSVDQG
ncbi:hypothetical protein U9M48_003439 [Paspalum notatum var. saurae]|uniref:DUF8040 domain-containing protein n=1 Tax=Paspalum notatum var. saurae TaxID=547442 RepID=A0AAQ3PL08_PASNO